jgi:hypothetical protein
MCAGRTQGQSLQLLSTCPGFEGKVGAEPVMSARIDKFKPHLRQNTVKQDPHVVIGIRYYQDDKIEGGIDVEAMARIGRQTTFDWP